jgi:hypothetical protein
MKHELVIPSEIPWAKIKGKDLEECLYWLLNAMGGKDIEWRIGGSGDGAADQGRDLEVTFYLGEPDGELTRQKWWIEAKGRSSTTVPPAQVKSAVLNAVGRAEVDVLVVASSSTFSNPTRDWVRDWQRDHARPKIRLWDRHSLEKLVCENPDVAVRLFSTALSPQGRLEVVRSRFWNYAHYAGEPTLADLWRHRAKIKIEPQDLLAVQASEFANGSIEERPWGMLAQEDELPELLGLGLLNTIYFCIRADNAGTNQRPYVKTMAYVLLLVLDRLGSQVALETIQTVWEDAEEQQLVITSVVRQLQAELRDICVEDCRRITADSIELKEKELENYWKRLELPVNEAADRPARFLVIEHRYSPCKIGFNVDSEHSCPIVDLDDERKDLQERIAVLEHVLRERRPRK